MVTSCSFACGCIALLPLPAHGSYTAEEASVAAVAVAVGLDEMDEGNIHSEAPLEVLPVMLCNALAKLFAPFPCFQAAVDTKEHADSRGKNQESEAWAWLLHVVLLAAALHYCRSLLTAHILLRKQAWPPWPSQSEVLPVMLCNALRSFLPPSLAFRLWTPKGTPTRVAKARNPRLGHGYFM